MSVHSFVAQFLNERGYHGTLRAFEAEYGKKIAVDLPCDETLENIVADRMKYLQLEESNDSKPDIYLDTYVTKIIDSQIIPWSAPYPKHGVELGPVNELVIDSTIIHIADGKYLVLATSSKALSILDLKTKSIIMKIPNVIGNVVRCITSAKDHLILCGMNGKVSIGKLSADFQKFVVVSETQIHPRLVTDMKVINWGKKSFLISVGWDFNVKIHEIDELNGFELRPLGQPYKLSNQASCLDAVVHQNKLYVLICMKDITLVNVFCVHDTNSHLYLDHCIALNDAEFSASGFTPMTLRVLCKDKVPLVAVGTSHEPYMRVIVVPMQSAGNTDQGQILRNQIMYNYTTLSPQDKYSDAKIAWRSNGNGIWVIGDDGTLRGIDLSDGSIAVKLEGHEGRIKSILLDEGKIISCGIDRKVLQWT